MTHRYPLTIAGTSYPSEDALVADVERRGRGGITDHPGQMYPAEHFESADAAGKSALSAAAARLARSTDHPGVFLTAVQLGGGTAFLTALLDRLEQGPPLPPGPGVKGATLHDDVYSAFANWAAASDAAVRGRIADHLIHEGRLEQLIIALAWADPDKRMLPALLVYAKRAALDPTIVGIAAGVVARDGTPADLVAAATAVRPHPKPIREQFFQMASRAAPHHVHPGRQDVLAALDLI